jgi:hypothetical protein
MVVDPQTTKTFSHFQRKKKKERYRAATIRDAHAGGDATPLGCVYTLRLGGLVCLTALLPKSYVIYDYIAKTHVFNKKTKKASAAEMQGYVCWSLTSASSVISLENQLAAAMAEHLLSVYFYG